MRHSKRSLEGVLLIDNRAAPPVPSFGGTPAIAGGATFESACVTCSHCHRQVVLNPDRSRERGYCPKCDKYVCDTCESVRAKTGDCVPFNAFLDRMQEQAFQRLGSDEPQIVLTDHN